MLSKNRLEYNAAGYQDEGWIPVAQKRKLQRHLLSAVIKLGVA
jgi:hypothetical protein